jgi:hypothetical protein
MGHPAHFHLFKNSISALKKKGHSVSILIKKKDILEDLLQRSGLEYHNILPEGRKDHKAGIAFGMLKRDWRLLCFCLRNRPDLMLGTSTEIGHVGTLLRIPTINVNEDDADVVPLYSKLSYPWSTYILSPDVCNNGKWEHKSIKYPSYHELAYLHPGNFAPDPEVVKKYFHIDKTYFLIRFAKLTAHHDTGIRGITNEIAMGIIKILEPHGSVYITSERPLETEFEKYRMNIDLVDIHHIMNFASIYIGDSQTMAAEAGVLGIPFVRFNDFVGRIGYLRDIEEKYKLGFGIRPDDPDKLHTVIGDLLSMKDRKVTFIGRRNKMLTDKINLAEYMTWFIEDYPSSVSVLIKQPDYLERFKLTCNR